MRSVKEMQIAARLVIAGGEASEYLLKPLGETRSEAA